jgi:CRP-like cAMP-binding protein
MARPPTSPRSGNRLLDRLPGTSYEQLRPHLRASDLKARDVLYEVRADVDQIYFPVNCVTSSVTVMESGTAIEVATVGREGVLGLPALSVVAVSPHRVFAQIPGKVLRIEANRFNAIARADIEVSGTMALYQQAFLFQVSQSVACNGLHIVSQRCCRWLLLTHDRVDGDIVALTHEFLSLMLGVRRASVSVVLSDLQKQGLIQSGAGKIKVLDRKRLEEAACECHRAATNEYERLLGKPVRLL